MEKASLVTAQQLSDFVIEFFNQHMPFNQLLGFEVSKTGEDKTQIRLVWDDKLMGNPIHKILHGGVTAAILDTVGSVAALLYGIKNLNSEAAVTEFQRALPNGGTLDMRVDYLRPGKGKQFIASAEVIRQGRKVAVCRMELHNEEGLHIATGTGTYMVG
ncbi:MAG: hypothetical protein ACI965_001768 [Paraglaciecola sp.]|jgi:uncharacterized protein (TIGR00369 family)